MSINVAINGFGRIGRMILRAAFEASSPSINICAINDLASNEAKAHLFKYDSTHGTFKEEVQLEGDNLLIGDRRLLSLCERDLSKLPWQDLGIDIVLECSGQFLARADLEQHLTQGAKYVVVSAPAKEVDKTIVYGVNHSTLAPEDRIISNASCTTNCLAPIASIMHRSVGIEHGHMTTIHAYTGDQSLLDRAHEDPRRARSATMSMIPTSTGAAQAIGLVLPELDGTLKGSAIRVPTPNVSLVDFVFRTQKPTTIENVHQAIKEAANGAFKKILAINDLPLVSCDFNHHPASAIVDLTQTTLLDSRLCRIVAWYDNEWGFSHRMLDVTRYLEKFV